MWSDSILYPLMILRDSLLLLEEFRAALVIAGSAEEILTFERVIFNLKLLTDVDVDLFN